MYTVSTVNMNTNNNNKNDNNVLLNESTTIAAENEIKNGNITKKALKCYCSDCPQSSCYTDGLCFAQLSLDQPNVRRILYRCLNESQIMIHPGMLCQETEHHIPEGKLIDLKSPTPFSDNNYSSPSSPLADADAVINNISKTLGTPLTSSSSGENSKSDLNKMENRRIDKSMSIVNNNTTNKNGSTYEKQESSIVRTDSGSPFSQSHALGKDQPKDLSMSKQPVLKLHTHQVTKCCKGLDFCNQQLSLDDFPEPNHPAHLATSPVVLIVSSMIAFFGLAILIVLALNRPRPPKSNSSSTSSRKMIENDTGSTTSREPLIGRGAGGVASRPRSTRTSASVAAAAISQQSLRKASRNTNNIQNSPTVCSNDTAGILNGPNQKDGTIGATAFTITSQGADCNGGPPAQVSLKSSMGLYDPSSGSGAGSPMLTERSIAREITVLETVGRGRSAEVRKGLWRGEFVAVKIFTSVGESSWFREVEIYQTSTLRHENILRFIAADNRDNSVYTELWLVTDYHPLGSVYGFLSNGTIDLLGLIKLTYSIADALSYLHTEIKGTSPKPAIAHRDLKSRNILVKVDGTCALADFGLAVSYQASGDFLHIPANPKQGTKRYMPPEILMGNIDMKNFDSFTRADMYSLGLVLWEICRRTRATGVRTFLSQNPSNLQCLKSQSSLGSQNINGQSPASDSQNLGELKTDHDHSVTNSFEGTETTDIENDIENRKSSPLHKLSTNNQNRPNNSDSKSNFEGGEDVAIELRPMLVQKQQKMNGTLTEQEVLDQRTLANERIYHASCEPYELPYTEQLGNDPSFESVHKLVAIKGFRPQIPDRWMTNEILRAYVEIMRECWYHNPKSRLTALRVKKSITNIRAKLVR